MTWSPHLFLIPCIFTLACTAEEIDWKKIALETDEPSTGRQIERILPNYLAEKIGLNVGDYIVQIGDQQVRESHHRRSSEERVLFFVRKGGKLDEAVVRGTTIGYHFSGVFRPWLAYLRGEIGTPSEKWENEVVETLILLQQGSPDAIEQHWNKALEKGYPEDELDGVIRAVIASRRDEPASIKTALDKVVEEFEVIPMVYLMVLEDLALASNQTGVLRELNRLDPASSITNENQIKLWEKLDAISNTPAQDLLELAGRERGRDIFGEITRIETDKNSTRLVESLRDQQQQNTTPGHYRAFRGKIPEDVSSFHLNMTVIPDCSGYDSKWSSNLRVSISSLSRPRESNQLSHMLCQIGLGDSPYEGTYVSAAGGHNSAFRLIRNNTVRMGLYQLDEAKKVKRIREKPTKPHQLDLICRDGEAAAFYDGECYTHLPVSRDHDGYMIEIHISGMSTLFKDINVWELNP